MKKSEQAAKVGTAIKTMRMSRNMTQAELASQLNVAKSTVGMWENGYREPDLDTIEALADLFNVPMSALIGGASAGSVSPSELPENMPNPPGVINRRDTHKVTVVYPANLDQPAGGLDGIIAQLEALKATQADPRYNLTQREKNLVDAFRELPKRMQDKALRIIAALGDQVEGV